LETETIDYPMTADYRKYWGCIDAAREIVQNCLDNKKNESTFSCNSDGFVQIETQDYYLPMSAFALGESVKADNSIGGFGEGFKLALMILQREGCDPIMEFGTKVVEPRFMFNELLQVQTFSLEIKDNMVDGEICEQGGLSFIFNIPVDKLELLKDRVNVFADNVLPLPEDVDILKENPGRVMVNGLFVCEEAKFKYGYNFSPKNIELGCDRQIASTFGMAWETSKVWADKLNSSNADDVLSMMTNGQMDVTDIHYHLSEGQAKKITEAFVERFGHVEIKPMGSTLGYGMAVGDSLYSTMHKSGYTKVANPHEEDGSPYRIIKELLAKEKKHMRAHAVRALNKLIEQSKSWEKKK